MTTIRRADYWVGNLSGALYTTDISASTITATTISGTDISATNISATNYLNYPASGGTIIADGVSGDPITATNLYATTVTATNLSGNYQATYVWNSGPLSANAILSASHGLGTRPNYHQVSLVCMTANCGFAVDDEIFSIPNYNTTADLRWGAYADAATVYFNVTDDNIAIARKDSAGSSAITLGYWQARIRLGI